MFSIIDWLSKSAGFILNSILIPIACSIVASRVFWRLSFRRLTTNIQFAPALEKSKTPNGITYRVRLINTGKGDLFDVKYVARMSYRTPNSRPRVVYIDFGQRSEGPVLYGKNEQNRRSEEVFSWTAKIEAGDEFFKVFTSKEYSKQIIKKAKNKTLTLADIIQTYNDSFFIKIYVFGTDSITGVKKMFQSPRYRTKDIKEGKYKSPNVHIENYEQYVHHILSINEVNKSN